MVDSHSRRDDDTDGGVAPARSSPTVAYPGTPRWVKVSGIVVLVLVLLLVATALGLHTPGGPGGHGF